MCSRAAAQFLTGEARRRDPTRDLPLGAKISPLARPPSPLQSDDLKPDAGIVEQLKKGAYFYKHDFGRAKRGRRWVVLSNDGMLLRWRSVGTHEVVAPGDGNSTARSSSPARSSGGVSARLKKSASFSRYTNCALSDVSHIIYGPYTDTFAKKTAGDRQDARWMCFSLVMRESRTIDFAAELEESLLLWLLGLQQLIAYFSPQATSVAERWTLPKLHLQKLRLKVSGESDRTGQGPYDVVLSAVLDAANDRVKGNDKATMLQAAWRRRNVQAKFQTAVGEMMEIDGLLEELSERERDLAKQQAATGLKIETAMKLAEQEEPPPSMPSEKDMKDPKKMQEYMLQMGEYSARQQLKLSAIEDDVKANQQVTAEVNRVAAEKRQLKDMHARLQFSLNDSQKETLSDADLARVQEIQKQLGVTPRGGIYAAGVREVRLFKEAQNTRLGIIFHQSTPEGSDVSSDYTPRAAGGREIILPVIKVLDKSGIAGACPDLKEGDQVLSVNGQAAISNVQAVQMLRDACGPVVLAVRDTTLAASSGPAAPPKLTGLKVLNPQ
jgi:hypothetical protein